MNDKRRTIIKVERVGGFAGFGSANLRSEGEIDLGGLADDKRREIERLLERRKAADPAESLTRDGFTYLLTWQEDGRERTLELSEGEAPESVRSVVKDRLT